VAAAAGRDDDRRVRHAGRAEETGNGQCHEQYFLHARKLQVTFPRVTTRSGVKCAHCADQSRSSTDRLRCEAKVAASLHNPRIVEIPDTGTDTR
jgi:hypothetical protein